VPFPGAYQVDITSVDPDQLSHSIRMESQPASDHSASIKSD